MKLEKVTVARADGQGQVGHFKSPSADTYLQLNVNVEINRTYTLHGYIKSATNGTLSCLGKSVATTTSWNHFSMQVVPSSKIFNLVFSPGEYWFYNFKLEKGTIMTQWSPNGEDLVEVKQHIVTMGSSINQLQDKITQKVWMTDVNTATGKVDSHVSTVEQTANKINWLVKSGTDSSNMALTDNAYSLIAKNIDLTGKVKFSSFDSSTQSRLTPLKPTRTWTSKFTTIGTTATCNLSDFNRTPIVGDIFSNTDGGSNTGTWQVTVVNGNSVTIKLLSCDAPAKSASDAASEAAKKAKAISDNIYTTNTTTINGGKITTGSITADQISSKTITADKIAAGAITAEKIATDAIKSNNYVANSTGSYLNLKDGSFDSKNLKWTSSGVVTMSSATFSGSINNGNGTNAYINPSYQELKKIIAYLLEAESINTSLYDFDKNGAVDILDTLAVRQIMAGVKSFSSYPLAKQSVVKVKIDTSNPEKLINITGTNMWGRNLDNYFGINGLNTTNITSNYINSKIVDIGGSGSQLSPFCVYSEKNDRFLINTSNYFDKNCSVTIGCDLNVAEDSKIYGQLASGSDRNIKHDISALDKEKTAKFIYSLTPSQYKFNAGTSNRYHHGLIAQEVKEAMGADDWGLYIDFDIKKIKRYDEHGDIIKEGHLALCYEELIPDLIATVQSQNNRINFLEKQIPQLQNQILQLLTQLNNINGGN